MNVESLLLTIEGSLAIGGIAGLIVGVSVARPKFGCLILLAVPLAMIAHTILWQRAHPENLRSTSGLDFIFGPLWPSLGAIAGFMVGVWLRSMFDRRA